MKGREPNGAGRKKREGETLAGSFGRYDILGVVGQGGMGTVYRARHQTLGNVVALKVLHPRWSERPKFVERFLAEARSSGRLRHPNVVRGIDAGTHEGRHFFAMEYVDGPGLDEVLAAGGRLPEKKSLGIALDVARALEHAWQNRVVHRDIKPGNILVGRDGVAKLTDLGLALRLDKEGEQPAVAMGTPDYISPEQIQALPDVDIRTDIYSLGATLYHLLTGHPPYAGDAESVMRQHLDRDVPDPALEVPDLSPQTARVLRKMAARRREDRYRDPTELVKDLEAVLAGETVAVQQAGRALASRRLRRRSPVGKGLAALLAVIAGIALLLFLLQFAGGKGETARIPPRRPDPGKAETPNPTGTAVQRAEEELRRAGEAVEGVRTFEAAHPDDYDGILSRYEEVARTFGDLAADACRAGAAAVRGRREVAAKEAVDALLADFDERLLQERYVDLRRAIGAFLEARAKDFGPTEAYGRARRAHEEAGVQAGKAADRHEGEARRRLEKADFEGARAEAAKVEAADPERFAARGAALLREVAEAERRHREAEDEREGLRLLVEARGKAAGLVREWRHGEAQDLFLAVRAQSRSAAVRAEASRDLADLDHCVEFLRALGEAQGAVGRTTTLKGKTGRIVEVSKGYVFLEVGRVRTGFRLQELGAGEILALADLGLPDEPALKRGLAVYSLYAGKREKARALLAGLDLTEDERAHYAALLG